MDEGERHYARLSRDGHPRILPDGTRIRFTEQALFEVVFPDGRTETWNPVSGKIGM